MSQKFEKIGYLSFLYPPPKRVLGLSTLIGDEVKFICCLKQSKLEEKPNPPIGSSKSRKSLRRLVT